MKPSRIVFFSLLAAACGPATLLEEQAQLRTTTVELISDCPKYFPPADRGAWKSFDGEFYFIDAAGRPLEAYKYLPPIVTAPRISACQTSIGAWGDLENPGINYDGGHLIGTQLGGWGGRANIVPQDANLNRGNWVALENKVATCTTLPAGQLKYAIAVHYLNSTTLIPDTMSMTITNRQTGDTATMTFENIDHGGPNGTSEKNRGIAFLTAQGCK